MPERLWSYGELKFIKVNERGCSSEELAEKVNNRFYNGETVRCAKDIEKIKGTTTIFCRKRDRSKL